MDRKSKILSTIIALAILTSVGITIHKTLIKKDFEILDVEKESVTEVAGQEMGSDLVEGEMLDIN